MKIESTELKDVLIVEPDVFEDRRGFFMELYNEKRYLRSGIARNFVQDNLSYSVRGTLRGLHFQLKQAQAKLVQVLEGEIFDVAVDVRYGSPTFGKWVGEVLSSRNRRQLFIPEGFAHGFCVLSETAYFMYKCSDFYSPGDERGLFYADPAIAVKWPVTNPVISEKDRKNPFLDAFERDALPVYKGEAV